MALPIKRNILGRKIVESGSTDFRYSLHVFLIRENRPRYWSFHCPRCGEKLVELDGQVAYMSDVAPSGKSLPVIRVRCNSRTCGGRQWFEFGNLS